jgi:large subunit ribosomal protein L22
MYQASAKYVRLSTQKAARVLDMVQKKQVEVALNNLAFTTNKSARVIEKIIKSAMANAQNVDKNLDIKDLYVKELRIGTGPYLRRFRPKAMGRAGRIRKPISHITVILDVEKE